MGDMVSESEQKLVDVNCANCGTLVFRCKEFFGSAAYCGEGCIIAHTGKPVGELKQMKVVKHREGDK